MLKKRFGFNQGFAVYDDEMPTARRPSGAERRAAEVVDRAIRGSGRNRESHTSSGPTSTIRTCLRTPSPFREKYKGGPTRERSPTRTSNSAGCSKPSPRSPRGETIIAVLSDHGESFSEHGEYAHGVFLYDSTLRIPFMMAGPGVPAGLG